MNHGGIKVKGRALMNACTGENRCFHLNKPTIRENLLQSASADTSMVGRMAQWLAQLSYTQ